MVEIKNLVILVRDGKRRYYSLTDEEMDALVALLEAFDKINKLKKTRALEESRRQTMSMSIAQLCKSKGYTQAEVARKIGVSRQTISLWAQGKSVPTLNSLATLAELFGVAVKDIWLPHRQKQRKE